MRLINSKYNLEIPLIENVVNIIVVENTLAFSEMISDIWHQVNGEEGAFILSEVDKLMNISKEMQFISNPFAVSCNDKKILSKIYQDISGCITENYQEHMTNINSQLIQLFDFVSFKLNYNIEFDFSATVENFCKIYNMRIDSCTTSLLEQISDYMKIYNEVCKVNKFVFLNLKQFLTSKDLEKLYEFCFYQKIYMILFEGSYNVVHKNEKVWILDKDLCIIELSESNNTLPV